MNAARGGGAGGVEICSACGVMLGTEKQGCSACAAPRTEPARWALEQPDESYWVAVRASFTCSACRFDSPLDYVELDDSVTCLRCGIEQRFDPAAWGGLVEHAHGVGDLATVEAQDGEAPRSTPPGNPHEGLGARARTWAKQGHWSATLGNPLCADCKAPLRVAEAHEDHLDVVCSACSERRSYELPRAVRGIAGLAGVLAEELELGAREARVEGAAGVTALHCPGCGASLGEIAPGAGTVLCRYCNTSCRVSARAHARAGHAASPPKTWWMLLTGPSELRTKLERRARANEHRDRQRAQQRDATRTPAVVRPTQPTPPIFAASPPPQPPRTPEPPPKRRVDPSKKAERKALLPLLLVMGIMPIGAVLILLDPFGKKAVPQASAAGLDDARLARFSFDMPVSALGEHFGVPGKDDMTLDFRPGGVVRKARIHRGAGPGPRYGITIDGGEKLDVEAALARLEKLAPNRLEKKGQFHEINVAKSLLRFDPSSHPLMSGSIQVSTWERDDARARALANAFWSLARHAAYGGAEPSDAALALVNGPKLGEAAKLAPLPAIEGAAEGFRGVFAGGACATSTNLADGKTRLSCEVDVDHAFVRKLGIEWPNGAGTKPEAVRFTLAKAEGAEVAPGAISACLDKALGPGEKLVVDHATGESKLCWKLPKGGGELSLDAYAIVLRGAGEPAPPSWLDGLPELLSALAVCEG